MILSCIFTISLFVEMHEFIICTCIFCTVNAITLFSNVLTLQASGIWRCSASLAHIFSRQSCCYVRTSHNCTLLLRLVYSILIHMYFSYFMSSSLNYLPSLYCCSSRLRSRFPLAYSWSWRWLLFYTQYIMSLFCCPCPCLYPCLVWDGFFLTVYLCL
jgi:hypothetical protein